MTATESGKTVVAVLSNDREALPPGLEPVAWDVTFRLAHDGPSLKDAIKDARVLLAVDFRNTALAEAWPEAKRLEWVHATSAGVDALLFPDLIESDVTLTNATGIFDRGIAEYVLGLILAYAKDLPGTLALQQDRRWKHRDSETIEGKRALVVGAGSIGRTIGRLLAAAGMEVAGLAGRAREDDPVFGTVHGSDALADLLPDFDYVVLAAPLTPATRHMIDARMLERMSAHARLINIGRGPLVDTKALIKALKQKRIAGAALDVFEQEPLPRDHPLWDMEGVIVSPHMAGDLIGWREALSAQFIENFRRWRKGEALFNVVDKKRGYAART